jgi:H+-transporting ATPase
MPWKKRAVKSTSGRVPPEWLQTSHKQGLADGEAKDRLHKAGRNELESKKENQYIKFFTYFQGPILYSMEIAVVLAAGLRDWVDLGT